MIPQTGGIDEFDAALLAAEHDVAAMGVWLLASGHEAMFCSRRLLKLLGSPAVGARTTVGALLDALPSIDLDGRHALARALGRNEGLEPIEVEVAGADGIVRTLEFRSAEVPQSERWEIVGTALDVSERKLIEERLEVLAYYDELSGLPNRLQLHDTIERAIGDGESFTLVILELPELRVYNTSLGRETTNRILQFVAHRLRELVPDDATVARYTGDDFAIVLPRVSEPRSVRRIVKTIMGGFDQGITIDRHDIFLDPAIGIASAPRDGNAIEPLFRAAETAGRRAQMGGGERFAFYESAMHVDATRALRLESELRRAIERDELHLQYQPIISASTGKIEAAEALLRWTSPVLGRVSPADAIAVAERTGLIYSIGEWVLREAATQNSRWLHAGQRPIRIAVNVSARQFQQPSFAKTVTSICESAQLEPSYLEIEMTETSMIEGLTLTKRTLETLRSLKVRISVDDFGTGYSSLSYLGSFPLDVVKIDRSFVANIGIDRSKEAIAQAIVTLAHGIGLHVVAEGVETQEQYDRLVEMGCDALQGYFLSVPLDPGAFGELMQAQ